MSSFRKILACIRRADNEYNLIEDGDRIAIGLSGGKDSMVLLHALSIYQKFPHKKFEFIPIFLDLGFPGNDATPLKEYCAKNGFDCHVEDASDVYKILNVHRNDKNLLPCSICSRMKKAAINRVAHQLNCNKVAFAHHADDAIETLLMNELYGGRIGTFSPKMYLSNTQLTFIRPLIYARESDIESIVKKENIPVFKNQCGNDKNTEREAIKKLTKDLYNRYDQSKENFLYMLNNFDGLDLWFEKEEHQLNSSGLVIRKVVTQQDYFDLFSLRKDQIIYNENETIFIIRDKGNVVSTISFVKQNDRFLINTFISKNHEYDSKILHYIENEIVIHTTPAIIDVTLLDNKTFLENEGYVLVENKLQKTMSKKHPVI